MKKFIVLYVSSVSAKDQMTNATPEMSKAGMEQWMAWMQKVGSALVDGGSPLSGPNQKIGGYSILQGESLAHVEAMMKDHPHRHAPGASVEIYEALKLPGM
jgi:hypothetical protein